MNRFMSYVVSAIVIVTTQCTIPARAEVIKIGIIGPMSGPFGTVGKGWEAVLKAFQKIHGAVTAGGHAVQLVYRDLPDTDPAKAKALAQELVIKERVQYLAGLYFTPDAIAVGAVATESKTPVVYFNAATSSILEKSDYLLRTSLTLPQLTVPMAKYALEQRIKSAVTIVADYSTGLDAESSFVKTFSDGGGIVLGKIRTPLKTTDFGPFLQIAKAAKPEAIFVFVPPGPPSYSLIKAYDEAGLRQADIRFLGTGELNETNLAAVGRIALGLESVSFYSPSHVSKENELFIKTVNEVSPETIITSGSVSPFDAMTVIYQMIDATDGKRDGAKAIANVKGFHWNSPRGPLKIDAVTRELHQNIYIRVVAEDPSGKLYNRELRTYEMQPDYGRAGNMTAN